jgi:hypothetical protein
MTARRMMGQDKVKSANFRAKISRLGGSPSLPDQGLSSFQAFLDHSHFTPKILRKVLATGELCDIFHMLLRRPWVG